MTAETDDWRQEIARVERRTSFLRISTISLAMLTLHKLVVALLFGDAS